MDRKSGDDRTGVTGKRIAGVVELMELHAAVMPKAFASDLEHRWREIDEMDLRLRKVLPDECGQNAGTGSEIDDSFRCRRNQTDSPAVEAIVWRDQLCTVPVVGGGGGIEDKLRGTDAHDLNHKRRCGEK